MKRYIIFILFSLSLFAQEPIEQSIEKKITVEEPRDKLLKTEKISKPAITTLISQIKKSKIEERRVLMNQLKVKLREMNKESRQKAMRELKHSFSKANCKTGQKKHKHQKHKHLQHQQLRHQPKFRQLGRGEGQGNRQK